jgi:tetratricopeptide (TPR) repeat protein
MTTLSVPQALALAVQQHQAGQLAQAEQLYRAILQADPHHVEALFLLGVLARQMGQPEQAAALLGQAVRLKPDSAAAHYELGVALQAQGRLAEARASLEQALRCQPDYAEAHLRLGLVCQAQGRPDEELACYQQAVRCQPGSAAAHANLGVALQEQGRLAEARDSLERALRLRPDFAAAHNNLGVVLQGLGLLEQAEARFRQALGLQPDYAEAHNNLGNVLQAQGKLDGALASFEQALRLQPDYADARLNRAQAWLLGGEYERGWPEYEWRWRCKAFVPPTCPPPLWDGSPLRGRTILLRAEQGLGDTLQFIRYAVLLKQQGATVVVECQKPLLRLLAGCPGIDRLIAPGDPQPEGVEVQVPLLSVPGLLGTTLANVPAPVPYLHADAGLVEHWAQQLRPLRGFKIGIAWQGNPSYSSDRSRSLPLARFAPLAQIEGVRLISLQKGPGTEQLHEVADQFPVLDLGSRLDVTTGAFMDTAAVMKNLDLIITSDTAIPHLAGALAVPVWVALRFVPDWRWLRNREDSPWYPTMRLFRQSEPGNWQEVFERITAAARKLCS